MLNDKINKKKIFKLIEVMIERLENVYTRQMAISFLKNLSYLSASCLRQKHWLFKSLRPRLTCAFICIYCLCVHSEKIVIALLEVSKREEGVMALHLPIHWTYKTRSGLEPVPR